MIVACILLGACTANVDDTRVNADGKPNNIMTGSDANPAPGSIANAGNPNPALADFIPVGYTDELQPMVQQLCTGSCHTGAPAPGPVTLNTAETLKAAATQAAAAITSGKMPPNAADKSEADKKLLAQLAISLTNWGRNEAYANALSDFTITWTPAVSGLANALCISCHKGDQPPAGLRLETQDQWKTAMPRILQAVENRKMPPKVDEVQGPRLLRYLRAWQDQGFP
ncbi:c-type cytochrome domain-containing protein [Oligoflexus tunisiensis]|uniref:c-type cytochrome domain-containing protein n=1 Tax=Oligoflexus tunisiensis TaxID=708132 RepID=UPI001FE1FC23|nr:c-type cytochrome domain-containing protein [Oligoflexus tunisiensis]